MNVSTIIAHSAELLRIIKKSNATADSIASEYLRGKKYLGSNDRKFISEISFSALRNLNLSDYIVNSFFQQNNVLPPPFQELINTHFEYLQVLTIVSLSACNDIPMKFLELTSFKFWNETQNLDSLFTDISNRLSVDSANIAFFWDSSVTIYNSLYSNLLDSLNDLTSNAEFCRLSSILFSIQPWIINTWLTHQTLNWSKETIIRLAESLLTPAPLTIRVSSKQSSIDNCMNYFLEQGVEANRCGFSPDGITLGRRIQLSNYEPYKNGYIEVQDEGSQIISYALSPRPGAKILDACAGAGGKSLHLAALCNDNCEIIANDVDTRKLKELSARAKRASLTSIKSILFNNKDNVNKYTSYFDHVLIDAPCSGLGTSRRMPLPKYRLNKKSLSKLTNHQLDILQFYSQFLKPGGVIVYSTCSLMPQENDDIIDAFLLRNTNFEPDSLNDSFKTNNIPIPLNNNQFKLWLLPSEGNWDGFFMARLRRID